MKNGGRRPGAGRKKKPETLLREMEIAERVTEAKKSFNFLCHVRDNAKVPWGIRLAAAQDIQDRVFGKPKQTTDLTSGGRSLVDILKEVRGDII